MSFFRRKQFEIPQRTIDDLKSITKVLFIDDQSFRIVQDLKEKDGWKNISRIRDVDSLTQSEVKEAHIIFVDIQGVGKKMGFLDEGMGLIEALRQTYPEKKIIMYSAESKGKIDALHPSGNLVDYRLRKTAKRYEFESVIEQFAKESFYLDNCVLHIKEALQRELGVSKSENEIKEIIQKIYSSGKMSDPSALAKAFSLSNIGSVASIIQLFLMPFTL